jgi:hypothetical protein
MPLNLVLSNVNRCNSMRERHYWPSSPHVKTRLVVAIFLQKLIHTLTQPFIQSEIFRDTILKTPQLVHTRNIQKRSVIIWRIADCSRVRPRMDCEFNPKNWRWRRTRGDRVGGSSEAKKNHRIPSRLRKLENDPRDGSVRF